MSDIIQVAYGELTTSFENEVMKAVQQVGIYVNKEELLKALELADKLVRCKDCKYYTPLDESRPFYCSIGIWKVNAEDFCSYGERKDNE